MNLPSALFSAEWIAGSWLLFAAWIWRSWRRTPWQALKDDRRFHLVAGWALGLALLWSIRAGIEAGLTFHVLGAMAATLSLGAPLATLALGLALAVVCANGAFDAPAYALKFLVTALCPVVFADAWRRFVARFLPAHFFVFIFVVAFFGSGLTLLVEGALAILVLWGAGAYTLEHLLQDWAPYFVLMGFAESWLSGVVITMFVVYRPDWVAAFDDARYLKNK
jgi:uncharacterized membrane protein